MPASIIGERRSGVEEFVHEIVVDASMELVGAGLHGQVEYAAAGQTELGRVVARLNGEFLNGVHARLGLGLGGIPPVGRVLAVNAHGLGVGGVPVDPNGGVARVIRAR